MPAQGLKLQILLKAVDKVTGPVKRIIKVSQGLQQQVVGTQRQLSNVASTQRAIAAPTQKMLKAHVSAQAERSQSQANIRFLTKTTPPRQSSSVASSQSILGYIATVSFMPLTYPIR